MPIKASNGDICSERKEVSEEHKELNKIKILFNSGEEQNRISHLTVFRVLSWPFGLRLSFFAFHKTARSGTCYP